ncbi:MAG: hypothetical protein ACYC9O_09635 [Candidatus Latescibacterota bacterium]
MRCTMCGYALCDFASSVEVSSLVFPVMCPECGETSVFPDQREEYDEFECDVFYEELRQRYGLAG